MHMIIFCGSQVQISAKKTGFALKFSSDIWSAAGELFTRPHQSLPEMSAGLTAIGEHCDQDSRMMSWPSLQMRNVFFVTPRLSICCTRGLSLR